MCAEVLAEDARAAEVWKCARLADIQAMRAEAVAAGWEVTRYDWRSGFVLEAKRRGITLRAIEQNRNLLYAEFLAWQTLKRACAFGI